MTGYKRFLLPLAFATLAAASASADAPNLIGSYKDWSAFQTTTNGTRVCYAMAKPKSMEPKTPCATASSVLASRRCLTGSVPAAAISRSASRPDSISASRITAGSSIFLGASHM